MLKLDMDFSHLCLALSVALVLLLLNFYRFWPFVRPSRMMLFVPKLAFLLLLLPIGPNFVLGVSDTARPVYLLLLLRPRLCVSLVLLTFLLLPILQLQIWHTIVRVLLLFFLADDPRLLLANGALILCNIAVLLLLFLLFSLTRPRPYPLPLLFVCPLAINLRFLG